MGKEGKTKVKLGFVEDFMLSGIAAVTSKTIAAPIERIKMVVQNQDEMLKRGTLEKPFGGIIDCGNWIMKNEGFGAFWKSNGTNCLRYFPTQALNFAFKGRVKALPGLKAVKGDGKLLGAGRNIAAGGIAGTMSLAFVYSLDYARTRLANDLKSTKKGGADRQFNGLFDVYRQTIASDGVAGLYRGFVISAVGIFIYRGFYFGLYDTAADAMGPDVSFGVKFAVGYAVTVVSGVLSYPIDTIRRRMMMTSGGDKALMYTSSLDCAAKIMKAEGFMSFFKGAGANILRGMAGAGVLAGFDELKQIYVKTQYGENCYA
jgi:solute carrier family 25 (adenine nucleotide translocator) protein 4/5/6/31